MELNFGPSTYEFPRVALFNVNQVGEVVEYYT